ncbi:unnamed protein product [Ambrosiozyma monospora]|uniref:Unnamed protein product n=1 Tax=Ambrosiozyma monospora TaxID=43982 RepID=A0ACB5T7Q2_AMBMO|nr:unnamed protein product [Ambrosiozyma monospora]
MAGTTSPVNKLLFQLQSVGYQATFKLKIVALSYFEDFAFLRFLLDTSNDPEDAVIKVMSQVIPFAKGHSCEVVPIIAGLVLKSVRGVLETDSYNTELLKLFSTSDKDTTSSKKHKRTS